MSKLSFWRTIYFVSLSCALAAIGLTAEASSSFKTLHSFDFSEGDTPLAGLAQGADGSFYGTTAGGWLYGYGMFFKITPAGTITTLHGFNPATDGDDTEAALVLGTDGNFYGTAQNGGAHNAGTVFKITPAGALTTLHSFDGTDGSYPLAGLVQGTDGNLYGTTSYGSTYDYGTVFKITPAGKLTTLHIFDGMDGAKPWGGVGAGHRRELLRDDQRGGHRR
jgi:uncharacterized repeat protein (TIGR03803 family)